MPLSMNRQVSFDYMNRELVWNGFAEMVLFLIPMINLPKLKNFLYRLLFHTENTSKLVKQQQQEQNIPNLSQQKTNDKMLLLTNVTCPICELSPIQVPYVCNPCGHVFCYYCIQNARYEQGNSKDFNCPKCSKQLADCKRATAANK